MFVTGRTAIVAFGGVAAAWITASTSVAWLWLLGTITLALVDAALAPNPVNVGVKRTVPGSVRLTEATVSNLTVANLGGRRIRGSVRDAWPPSAGAAHNRHEIDIAALDQVKVATPLKPTRRGDRPAAEVTVRTLGPLGVGGRQKSITDGAYVRVLPEFRSRRHLPSRLARLRELDGQTSVNLRGAGSEFDSLREYVVGDDVRTIDWRATARRADVVVRTFRPERDRRVYVLLDTSRKSASRVGDIPRIDGAIEACLLLGALATHAGDRVQVSAWDRREQSRAAGASPESLMPNLAEALAVAQPELLEPDWAGAVSMLNERLSQRALVVILTTVEPTTIESGLFDAVRHLQMNHQVLVASIDDPEVAEMTADHSSVDAVYYAAAAERGSLESEAVAMRLRQFGAEVVFGNPEELAPRVADTYLALKAAGRL